MPSAAKKTHQILLLDQENIGFDLDYTPLSDLGELHRFPIVDSSSVPQLVADHRASIVVANRVLFPTEVLAAGAEAGLGLIALTATGTNTVDLAAAARFGIGVCNIRGYSTNAVAQHTLALALSLVHKLKTYGDYVASQRWAGAPVFTWLEPVVHELSGQTWGIIGLGAIGQRVAELATAFGCQVQFTSLSGQTRSTPWRQVERDELLRTSDIVSVHLGLSDQSRNYLGYREFCLMRPQAILLNLGRGAVIGEADLARALTEGRLAAAGLDVLWPEPPDPANPLLDHVASGRLLLTPHVAWAALEARQRAIAETALNIAAFLNGESRNRVA